MKKITLLGVLLVSTSLQAELQRSGAIKKLTPHQLEQKALKKVVQKTLDFVTDPKLPITEVLDSHTIDETRDRISKGLALIKQLSNNHQIEPTDTHEHLNNIAAISWGFFALAVDKNQGFLGGTIVIEDPNLIFFNYFLDYTKRVNPDIETVIEEEGSQSKKGALGSSNCFSYARKSTHFNEVQKLGKGYEQFGIDMRYHAKEFTTLPPTQHFLPINKSQFLFGKLAENRSFVKFEHYGLCNKNGDLRNHANQLLKAKSPFANKPKPRRGENVPGDKQFNDLKDQIVHFAQLTALDNSPLSPSCKTIKFAKDIYNCAKTAEKFPVIIQDPTLSSNTDTIKKQLMTHIIEDFTSRGWEENTLNIRRGNEVILTIDEMKKYN